MRTPDTRPYSAHAIQDPDRKGTTMLIRKTRNRRLRELAQRRSGGLEVTLLWDERSDRLTVTVHDARTGEFFELGAPPDQALDVFYHPFVYV
jgi:hypothetical protein